MKLINLVVRVQILLLDAKSAYGYQADGVKLGEADRLSSGISPKGKIATGLSLAIFTSAM